MQTRYMMDTINMVLTPVTETVRDYTGITCEVTGEEVAQNLFNLP